MSAKMGCNSPLPSKGFVSGWKRNLQFLSNLEQRKLKELIESAIDEREEFFGGQLSI
jgi:hypothetical protein